MQRLKHLLPVVSRLILMALAISVSAIVTQNAIAQVKEEQPDPRNNDSPNAYISHIPHGGVYCCSPYILAAKDGALVCVVTVGHDKREGRGGQHMVSLRSTDGGKTWTKPLDIEPPRQPGDRDRVSTYGCPLLVPSTGRIYAIYWYDDYTGSKQMRGDMIGNLHFRYSDDHGKSWSAGRYLIPYRVTDIDRKEGDGGLTHSAWIVGAPEIVDSAVYFTLAKAWMSSGFDHTEGWFVRSGNILSENDPEKIVWQWLPDGQVGLRPSSGKIAEENNFVALDNGTLYSIFRTENSYLGLATSSDGGLTFRDKQDARYGQGRRKIKNVRGPAYLYRHSNGKFLLWFYNCGRERPEARGTASWGVRNPGWITAGVQRNGTIEWAEPEILRYCLPRVFERGEALGYPDFFEYRGETYCVLTHGKDNIALLKLDATQLDGLWNQGRERTVTLDGLGAWIDAAAYKKGRQEVAGRDPTSMNAVLGRSTNDTEQDPGWKEHSNDLPAHFVFDPHDGPDMLTLDGNAASISLSDLRSKAVQGFSIELWVRCDDLASGQTLFDWRTKAGKGIVVYLSADEGISLLLSDGNQTETHHSDSGQLRKGRWQHLVVTVDGSAQIVTFMVDGKLNDGGAARPRGFGVIDASLGDINGGELVYVGHPSPTSSGPNLRGFHGGIAVLRFYRNFLRTSQAVANFNAGPRQHPDKPD